MPMAPEYLEPIGLQAATSILASAELNLPRVKAVPGQRLSDLLRSTSVRSTSSMTSWMIACSCARRSMTAAFGAYLDKLK